MGGRLNLLLRWSLFQWTFVSFRGGDLDPIKSWIIRFGKVACFGLTVGFVSEIRPIHSLQYALQNRMAQFSPFIFTKCSSFFINGFDTASFLLLVKSTKTTILPWSTILPTHSFGLQSVRRSPRLALLTLVMLIPIYLHNVGQNANKKTHGTS